MREVLSRPEALRPVAALARRLLRRCVGELPHVHVVVTAGAGSFLRSIPSCRRPLDRSSPMTRAADSRRVLPGQLEARVAAVVKLEVFERRQSMAGGAALVARLELTGMLVPVTGFAPIRGG